MQLPVIVLGVLLLDGAAAQATQVQWSGDRLTVNAVNASLRALVEDVAQHAGIVVTGIDRLAGGRSIQIRDASLYEGLKVLLQGVNFVIVTKGQVTYLRIHSMSEIAPVTPGSAIHIAGLTDRVVVDEAGSSVSSALDPPDEKPKVEQPQEQNQEKQEKEETEAEAELEEAEQQLAELETLAQDEKVAAVQVVDAVQSSHATVRRRALQLLGARPPSPETIDQIAAAFTDDDMNVVLTASDVLAGISDELAIRALERQLDTGQGELVQFAALRSLALRAEVASLPAIRRVAREGYPANRGFAERLVIALEERAKVAPKSKG